MEAKISRHEQISALLEANLSRVQKSKGTAFREVLVVMLQMKFISTKMTAQASTETNSFFTPAAAALSLAAKFADLRPYELMAESDNIARILFEEFPDEQNFKG